VAELARYGSSVRALSAEELEHEYRLLAAQNEHEPNPDVQIKLSLLLSDPSAPFHDLDQAVRLLGDVMLHLRIDESDDSAFARLLYYLLSERACVDHSDASLAELLVSEREAVLRLQRELGEARTSLESERALRVTLQQQLDALKALEEQITNDSMEQGPSPN